MTILEWLLEWFENNSDLKSNEILSSLNEDFLIKGWIDSFTFINLITEIEEKYKISFNTDELQNEKFATLDGLANIIGDRIEKNL
ncbi:acyl carrier protein [Nitrosopumilus maritimus]|uniref:acyl carrier protein n=1 Tax=Nitrosopumilus maritimus TaxID=338192 RepID=UPI000159B025|nr:phosphopantetheine-binding protein [Nitrosopumilus maritimus]